MKVDWLEISIAIGFTWLLASSVNVQTNKLDEIAQTFQFQPLYTDPTRITLNSKVLIDLALTNKPELIHGSGVIHQGITAISE